ncbi:hypothetical protein [Streptomyces sp. 11-1-2]|uniref:hypothetical protein n=1 Tax=unclassified Streptomyces TaxID=2593676 RepID=UPI0013C4F6B1|nr:hypothetical protein [Streptomyces sp. 11-1-2]
MVRMTRRGVLVGVAALVLALAGFGGYLWWPAPTLDAADVDAVLPTKRDLPGFIPHDGLTGSLSVPTGNKDGRSVLAGADLDKQCRKWRKEGDDWACRHLRGVGMVVLERSENVFFRVKSDVLAYDDEDAAKAAWNGLVAANRDAIDKIPAAKEHSSDLGDAGRTFEAPGVTVLAIRIETVVMEAIIWDGSDQVSKEDEDAMVKKWPTLQLSKIEERLG